MNIKQLVKLFLIKQNKVKSPKHNFKKLNEILIFNCLF